MFFKLKNILILSVCLSRAIVAGKANKKTSNPEKFLIMQMAKLGDMVCTTPMFRAVKEKYPGAKVFVIGNNINKEVLAGNLDVDEYFVYENNFWELVKKLKKEKISFACSTHPNFLGLALIYLSGVKLISMPIIKNGFSPVETRLYKILINLVISIPHKMGSYAPREYLRLLEPIGVFSDNTKKCLYFLKQSDKKIKFFLLSNKIDTEKDLIVGISPSAGNKIKKWTAERFAKLADYIYVKYRAKIIIIGGKNNKKEAEEVLAFLDKNTKIINTSGLFNIDELKALMSKLSFFISVDTGPIYIAEAFDVPTIDIVGPIDEREQPPIGERHKIVKIESRIKPELHVMNASMYDYKEARRQIEEITVEMVTEKIDEIIKIIK